MKTIKQTYIISASVQAVWQAFVDPKIIDRWGGGPAHMDDKEGTEFTLWGGDIYGKNIKVSENKELVQEWFSESENKKWEKPSLVTFLLYQEKDKVKVSLVQDYVPDEDSEDIKNGWKEYYLGPLKSYLEEN